MSLQCNLITDQISAYVRGDAGAFSKKKTYNWENNYVNEPLKVTPSINS